MKKKVSLFIMPLLAFSFAAVPVYAEGASSTNDGHSASSASSDARAKQCQRREVRISSTLKHVADRGQKQVDLFSTIATRVENFATKNSKQPSNYADLVSAVDTQKANAQTAVDTLKNVTVSLKCDGTDQTTAQTYKGDVKTEIAALKDYRTAVKNLVVGVKSVTGQTHSSTNSSHSTGGNQ